MREKLLTLGMLVSASLLSACGSKYPSDEVSAKAVLPYAEQDIGGVKGLKIVDFERDNGWADTSDPSRYDIRYKYKLKLTVPLCAAIIATAKEMAAETAASNKASSSSLGDFFSWPQRMMNSMSLNQRLNEWVNSQGDGFKGRRESFYRANPECAKYATVSETDPDDQKLVYFGNAWAYFSDLGFPDTAQPNATTAQRTAWAAFTKTEKGWVSVDSLNQGSVSSDSTAGAPTQTTANDSDGAAIDTPRVNPANGLPMMGATDVNGNAYGTGAPSAINPANGQMMVPNTNMDTGGNAYGTSTMPGSNP
ncbi:hypothetical protein LMG28614_06724 [Paraburkholderia ultramafica]|uniref:Lipoprotein n=2 Tax=Paraburkholderia ultramafica TaxID=1544867 RepID=A0A6S7BPQ3_9BURK|nr:hypothetical protein LMG28614_06724 [Paraburkholderia ultramafica]